MSRHMIIPAVHIFLVQDNKLLLTRRFQTGYEDGKYSVPAGHVEQGESAKVAGIRESFEEVGVVISPNNLKMIHVMHRRKLGESDERVDFFFECKKWNGDVKNVEPEKCDDLRWVLLESLPKNTIPYVRNAVKNYRAASLYSEFGWN